MSVLCDSCTHRLDWRAAYPLRRCGARPDYRPVAGACGHYKRRITAGRVIGAGLCVLAALWAVVCVARAVWK